MKCIKWTRHGEDASICMFHVRYGEIWYSKLTFKIVGRILFRIHPCNKKNKKNVHTLLTYWLTNWLSPRSKILPESEQAFSYWTVSFFSEPRSTLPYSQESAISPCLESDKFSLAHSVSLKYVWIMPSHLHLGIFPSGFLVQIPYAFLPRILHSLPIFLDVNGRSKVKMLSMKRYGWAKVWIHVFLALVLDGGQWSAADSGRFACWFVQVVALFGYIMGETWQFAFYFRCTLSRPGRGSGLLK